MGCILDTPDTLRPTGKRRNVIKVASMREIERYGGWRKAVEAGVELPPMAGGALTLVNSGTVTPTVGTVSTVATDTPGTAQMYVVEVDTENMQSTEHLAIGVRRGTAKANISLVTAGGGAVLNPPATAVVPAASLAMVIQASTSASTAAPSDSQGNVWSLIANNGNAARLDSASIRARFDSALQADWLNDQIGLGPAYQNAGGDTFSGAGTSGDSELLWAGGLAWGGAAVYGSASGTVNTPTSVSVAVGDLVIAAATSSSTSATATAAGWTLLAAANGRASGWQIPGSAGAVTFAPTWSVGATNHAAIAAVPAMAGLLVGKAVFRGNQAQSLKQSTAFLINASEQMSFDILQIAGTARAFPWRLYHL